MTQRNNEYQLYRMIAAYLRLQYPKVTYHFDYAGLNLSKAQAGQMKAIQHSRGFPDLMILHPTNGKILFLELKADGVKLFNRYGECVTEHIVEQARWLGELNGCNGVEAYFAVGFGQARELIDLFLNC